MLNDIRQARTSFDSGAYADGFGYLRRAASASADPAAFKRAIEGVENEYYYMLRFIASGNDVEGLDGTLAIIASKAESIAHSLELDFAASSATTVFSGQLRYMRRRPEETLESLVSDYLAELDKVNADTAALTDTRRRATLERLSTDIFNRLWVEYPVGDEAVALLESVICDPAIPFYDRVAWVHALGLATQNYVDPVLIKLLSAAHACDDTRVSTAAAIWLVLATRRLPSDSRYTARMRGIIKTVASVNASDITDVLLEYCRCLGVEKLNADFKDVFGPELQQIGRAVSEEIADTDPDKLDELLMNPEWISDRLGTKGLDNLRNFVEAQQNGDDVFMATLGKMRAFEFFNSLSNWFLPFHTAHSMLAPVVDGEGAMIADAIAQMNVLCDSDKYAMILSMAQMPEAMRGPALTQMSQQFQSMSSMPEAVEALREAAKSSRRHLINNHLKNIYRFYKLFKTRTEFFDIFAGELDYLRIVRLAKTDADSVRAIAEELFRTKRYAKAAKLYSYLIEELSDDYDEAATCALLRKAAFAFEMAQDFAAAEMYYSHVLEADPDDFWSACRLAQCMLTQSDDENTAAEALDRVEPFVATHTDDPAFLRLLGKLYDLLERRDDAVSVYHNLEYISPDGDPEAKGLLARALLFAGDYQEALALFPESADDEINYYHALALWLNGDRAAALRLMASADSAGYPIPETLKAHPAAESFTLIGDMIKYKFG